MDNNETLYISFITLVNVYMWTVAYLYSPAVDSLQDIQYKEARREHETIMNQFYEQELPDISGRSESTQMSRGNGVEKRRYMKRDKTEKAKEKLWESIIKETEDEASDDSSEDDERIWICFIHYHYLNIIYGEPRQANLAPVLPTHSFEICPASQYPLPSVQFTCISPDTNFFPSWVPIA